MDVAVLTRETGYRVMAFVAFIFDCVGCWGKVKNTKFKDPVVVREHLLAEQEQAERQKK
jgi:hypothetical protein